jgi:hypothetical protein
MIQTVNRREQWRQVLEAEVRRWEAKSCDELMSKLKDEQVYEVDLDAKQFQVEVHILENASEYIHVCVSVDERQLSGVTEAVEFQLYPQEEVLALIAIGRVELPASSQTFILPAYVYPGRMCSEFFRGPR